MNDSDTSELGPGIYLDMDTTDYQSNLPTFYADHYAPLLIPYEKIFLGGSKAPSELTANTQYHLQFTSFQPGQAAQDNAELTITHSKQTCWLFCSSGAYCHIHTSHFGLSPIPGRIDWTPTPRRCAEWAHWFLPLLVQ